MASSCVTATVQAMEDLRKKGLLAESNGNESPPALTSLETARENLKGESGHEKAPEPRCIPRVCAEKSSGITPRRWGL